MGRAWRADYKGGIFHVIARGNNREYVFNEAIDKGYFLKLLKNYRVSMGYLIYGYVLMDNHYHILIQTLDRKLQDIMHQINNKYSKYFNNKYERVGHVFQGRYKSIPVYDERYMLKVLRYIHQNPVRAGLCKNVQGYVWSSDLCYRNQKENFVNTELVMKMLDSDIHKAIGIYAELMNEEETTDYSNLKSIGDEACEIACIGHVNVLYGKSLDEVLLDACDNMEAYELIKTGSRKRYLTAFKLRFIKKALEMSYGYTEIGDILKITCSAVIDITNRYKLK